MIRNLTKKMIQDLIECEKRSIEELDRTYQYLAKGTESEILTQYYAQWRRNNLNYLIGAYRSNWRTAREMFMEDYRENYVNRSNQHER